MSFKVSNCVWKLSREVRVNYKLVYLSGTGFFINIPSRDYKFFITSNHLLDQDFLNNDKTLEIYNINNEKKQIDLSINRFKYTDNNYDFTIIEILPEDMITNFLEIDEFVKSRDYKDEEICVLQYPDGKDFHSLDGVITKKKNDYLEYHLETEGSSFGAPIILKNNSKLIGMFKENHKKKKKNILDYCVPINLILNKLNFIKCVFNIKSKDVGKSIQLFNIGFNDESQFHKYNEDIDKKIDILIEGQIKIKYFKHQFFKEGKYNVYIIQKITLSDMSHFFNQCEHLEEVNLSFFKSDNVTDMRNLFCECSSLTKINFSHFNTENVLNMTNMFIGCESIKEIDLSNFQTENVTNMSYMFSGCKSLKELNVSKFDTSNVNDMNCMFAFCSSLNVLDLSNFKTDKVKNMNDMFRYCSHLVKLNLSSFNVSGNCETREMFFAVPSTCTILCTDNNIIAEFPKANCLGCTIF